MHAFTSEAKRARLPPSSLPSWTGTAAAHPVAGLPACSRAGFVRVAAGTQCLLNFVQTLFWPPEREQLQKEETLLEGALSESILSFKFH
ncbi:hypothetical protein NDU88_001287 [Pleurodeles waltl]|uniref:Uncharacterized protein n=1 Tax=Pleurodeles waltl TaxID=8319 RepID=A0AAV7LYY5_PLEWA|nr:hypothetical protein NDU88_001287 [Pleurodeles waltl]